MSHVTEPSDKILPQRATIFNRVYKLRRFLEMHHAKRNDYGHEGKAVQKETAGESEKLEAKSCEHRPNNTRQLKL